MAGRRRRRPPRSEYDVILTENSWTSSKPDPLGRDPIGQDGVGPLTWAPHLLLPTVERGRPEGRTGRRQVRRP